MNNRAKVTLVAVGAVLGLMFATVSTYDFVRRLDRQVHAVHCSFIPGMGEDLSGSSGCETTMMSAYSSIWRDSMWGGLPISLPAMAVFAFILYFAIDILLSRRARNSKATGLLALSTVIPMIATVVMGIIAMVELGAACKLCIGIYISSTLCFVFGLMAWRGSKKPSIVMDDEEDTDLIPHRGINPAIPIGLGVLFVALPVGAYVASAPEHDELITSCGTLDYVKDRYGVMVDLESTGDIPTIEVLDPLCPACRAFEHRFSQTPAAAELDRKALLFPLDNACNWMVDSAVHPGACTISEAMLCAESEANEVLEWSFENQEEILTAAKDDPRAAKKMVLQAFPKLRGCVGSAAARSKVNRSLRWAVSNRLELLTPQVYVAGVRLCNEDVDLGIDYALSHLVKSFRDGTLPTVEEKAPPPTLAGRSRPIEGTTTPTPSQGTPEGEEGTDANEPSEGSTGEPADPSADPVAADIEGGDSVDEGSEEPAAVPAPIPEPEPVPESEGASEEAPQ